MHYNINEHNEQRITFEISSQIISYGMSLAKCKKITIKRTIYV